VQQLPTSSEKRSAERNVSAVPVVEHAVDIVVVVTEVVAVILMRLNHNNILETGFDRSLFLGTYLTEIENCIKIILCFYKRIMG
jgi:hypothetical protein